MPIEIRELVIKAQIPDTDVVPSGETQLDLAKFEQRLKRLQAETVAECLDQVFDLLREKYSP